MASTAANRDVSRYITPQAFKEQFQADWANAQKLRNMLNDPDWMSKVAAFGNGWMDQHKVGAQVGTKTTFIEEGKIVNTTRKKYDWRYP
ncbi:hypothetical protein HJFPF1_04108 [Paramyrothecium foliicola]|nr:hypothetical protein HJFPF1_04108 [Paramyrothecium foliicola]